MLESFQTAPDAKPTGADLLQLLNQLNRTRDIQIAASAANKDGGEFTITLDLTGSGGLSVNPSLMSALWPQGRPVTQPFKSVYVSTATDGNTNVQLIPGAQGANSFQGGNLPGIPLSLKDSYIAGTVKAQGLIVWTNQPGKSITLVFSLDGEVRSGSQTTTISGGVTVTEGSSINSTPLGAAGTSGNLAATGAATILCPANLNRKITTVQITGGSVRVGDATVTTGGNGVVYPSGSILQWKNAGALYWVIESGIPVANGNEET